MRYTIAVVLLFSFPFITAKSHGDEGPSVKEISADFDTIPYPAMKEKRYSLVIHESWKGRWQHASGSSTGIYLVAAGKSVSYFVPVAPCWYFNDIDRLAQGKKITLCGAVTSILGKNVLLPRWIDYGTGEILIRNYNGMPFWEGECKFKKFDGKGGGMKGGGMKGGGMKGGGMM